MIKKCAQRKGEIMLGLKNIYHSELITENWLYAFVIIDSAENIIIAQSLIILKWPTTFIKSSSL